MLMRLMFGREPMRRFTVFEPPNAPFDRLHRAELLEFVSDRFDWAALLFGPLWLAAQRLWLPLLGYVAFAGICGALAEIARVDTVWVAVAIVTAHLVLGFEAHALVAGGLIAKGWRQTAEVSGRSVDECERRFFDDWLPAVAGRASASGGAGRIAGAGAAADPGGGLGDPAGGGGGGPDTSSRSGGVAETAHKIDFDGARRAAVDLKGRATDLWRRASRRTRD